MKNKHESPALAKNEQTVIAVNTINDGLMVDARELHQKLENSRKFSDWIKQRIQEYGFIENEDFFASQICEAKKGRGGSNRVDYELTLDMAKELSMLERNKQGRTIRKYFIEVEKAARRDWEERRTKILSEHASPYQERTAITVPMGEWTNKVWVENGVIYAGVSTLMKYLGYRNGVSTQYISRIGTPHCRSVEVGCQPHWFISYQGFSRLLEISRVIPDASQLEAIQRLYNVYVEKAKEDVMGYHFSMSEGFDILKELARTPIRKHRVIELFIKGAKKGRPE
jgi:phage anti-repressor protein